VNTLEKGCVALIDAALRQPDKVRIYDSLLLSCGEAATNMASTPRYSAPSYTWAELLMLGVDPVTIAGMSSGDGGDFIRVSISLPDYSGSWGGPLLSHPLNVALMFARHLNDPVQAKRCIEEYVEIVGELRDKDMKRENSPPRRKKYAQGPVGSLNQQAFWTPSWIGPDPEKHGLTYKIESPFGGFDNISLIGWFSPEGIARTLNVASPNIQVLSDSVKFAGKDAEDVLQAVARKRAAEKWNQSGKVDYENLFLLVRLMDRASAQSRLNEAKGVRAVLNIGRRDAYPDQMKIGLAALSQSSDVKSLSSYFGRAPTMKELTSIRGKGFVDVLYHLPWVLLEEVLAEEDADRDLRARLLRDLVGADTERLRNALANHGHRAELKPYPLLDPPTPRTVSYSSKTTTYEWDKVFRELSSRYTAAIEYRKTLRELTEDAYVSAVATTLIYHRNNLITDLLKDHPNWEKILNLTQSFAAPTTNVDTWF
jgi:hypothetical protein